MPCRWTELLLAGTFAFVAAGSASVAAIALLWEGFAHPQLVPAAIATAVIGTAFAAWTVAEPP